MTKQTPKWSTIPQLPAAHYLNINAGGTPHTADELDRVRAILASEATS